MIRPKRPRELGDTDALEVSSDAVGVAGAVITVAEQSGGGGQKSNPSISEPIDISSGQNLLTSRRGIIAVSAATAASIATVSILGRTSISGRTNDNRVAIGGSSMFPTLSPTRWQRRCTDCHAIFLTLPDQNPPKFDLDHCQRCGETTTVIKQLAADQIAWTADVAGIRGGDLVLLKQNERIAVKRILAGPGDRIEVLQNRLLVNEMPPDFSRSKIPPAPVAVFRFDQFSNAWLRRHRYRVYQHLSGRRHHPSPLDDNVTINRIARRLRLIDNFSTTVIVDDPAPRVCVYWRDQTVLLTPKAVEAGFHYSTDRVSQRRADIVLSPETPIAIRMNDAESIPDSIQIDRPIEFRHRGFDDLRQYPIQLRESQYFVVGDNDPISLDSRNHGPIQRDQIIGCVTRVLG